MIRFVLLKWGDQVRPAANWKIHERPPDSQVYELGKFLKKNIIKDNDNTSFSNILKSARKVTKVENKKRMVQ